MTELIMNEITRHRGGVNKMKRHSLKIDMTPMVDLGFLLISFFVMTIEMSRPTVARLNMPKDSPLPGTEVAESAALTFLLGPGNTIWYYHGKWENAAKENKIMQTSFSYKEGIGAVIRAKQILLDANPSMKKGRDELTIMMKPAANANYNRIVDVLDEITINNVKRYALVKITEEEKQFLKKKES